MHRVALVAAFLAALAGTGCSSFAADGFVVEARPPFLVLDNSTDGTVYYVALEAETATRADLNPDVTTWEQVPAGETLVLSYETLTGYEPGDDEGVVFWSTGGNLQQERVAL